jgi:hypothetical protein
MADPSTASASCEVRAEVLRRNWAVPIVSVVAAIVGVLVGRAALTTPAAVFGWVVSFVAVILAGGSISRNAFPRARRISLRASSVELAMGEEPPIAVDQIAEAKVDSIGAKHATMRITLRDGGRRWLRMSAIDATSVLRILGVSAAAKRASFALMIPFGWRFIASFLVLGVPWLILAVMRGERIELVMAILGSLCFLAPSSALIAWLAGWWHGRLVIAADGITVKWFVRETFIAFADMIEVRWLGVVTFIRLRSGRSLRLCPRDVPVTNDDVGAEGRALNAQLVAAFERAKRGTMDAQNVAALLAGEGRSGAQWLAHLDAVMGGAPRYRVAAPTPEVLSTIANDPTIGSEARAAAAAVLVRLDDTSRQTVRIAADACAEPALRDALVSISDAESDDAFASALERARKR